MRIALTFNSLPDTGRAEEVAEYDDPSTINAVASGIRKAGHEVLLVEANLDAFDNLRRERPDFVFNIAEGIGGGSRESQIPMMLDMLGIPYSGSDALTLGITLDKRRNQEILSCNGVAVPRFQVLSGGDEPLDPGMDFPLFVKPIGEGSSIGISAKSLVKNEADLRAVARELIAAHRQPVIVEEYIEGKEVTVALLGNPPRVLPIVEIEFSHLPEGVPRFDCYEVKWIYEDRIACPAPIDEATRSKVEATALAAFGALGCRDLCRIDMRIDSDGDPYVIDVNALPGLIPDPKEHSRFPAACYAAGMSYDDIIRNILEVAMARCGVKA